MHMFEYTIGLYQELWYIYIEIKQMKTIYNLIDME